MLEQSKLEEDKEELKNISLSDFYEEDALQEFLKYYDDTNKSAEIEAEVNRVTKQRLGKKTAYDFTLAIKSRSPITISGATYLALKKYIDAPEFWKLIHAQPLRNFDLKKHIYQDTLWSIYFYDSQENETANGYVEVPLLSRGLLKFLPFGMVEIKYFQVSTQRTVTYYGEYATFKSGEFLILNLDTNPKERNLIIQVNVGINPEVVDLAIGTYQNIGHSTYCATILMVKETCQEHEIKIKVYENIDGQASEDTNVPPYAWKMFAKKDQNWLIAPIGINSLNTINRWLKERG